MAFTVNLSTAATSDAAVIQAYDQAFIVAQGQNNVMDQFVEYKAQIGAKAIHFPKFGRLTLVTAPIDESNDVDSETITDSQIVITPKEFGKAVTRTELASLQTGGTIDLAAARVVGLNMGASKDSIALGALSASTNVIDTGAHMGAANLDVFYNKLARANIPGFAGMDYVMVAHDDVISDLRSDTGLGSWVDVSKYALPETILKNEVGMFKGFRVVRDNHAAPVGTGGTASYPVYFLGQNALGLAESKVASMIATGPFDKLARFINLGWYGVFGYSIIDTDAVWVGKFTSSKAV
jgi:N4-gp56 family major capsid protein